MNIAIFASGNGSNAESIVNYFTGNKDVCIKLILTNKRDAYVIQRAKNLNIPYVVFFSEELRDPTRILKILQDNEIDFIVLAGFLLLIPEFIIEEYSNRIVNIHPALLPKFGGKGMYGMNVHKAVIEANEKMSGITIHYVNKNYDEGDIIFNEKCAITDDETAESLAEKIHQLEHEFYPKVIENVIKQNHLKK